MAFKKRDYKYWLKFFHDLIFKNGCDPYVLINDFQKDLIAKEEYEAAKAAQDVFNQWYEKFKMSQKETSEYLTKFYKNHPVYGGTANFPLIERSE